MKLLQPKAYEAMMNRVHKPTGITYRDTIEAYDKSKRGEYLKESIELRNKYINGIIKIMIENKKGVEYHPEAINLIRSYIIEE